MSVSMYQAKEYKLLSAINIQKSIPIIVVIIDL